MKNAAKLICAVMTLVLVFGMAGCFKHPAATKSDIKELKKNNGNMLVIISYPQEAMTEEQFEAGTLRMSVSYSGYAYNPNPFNNSKVRIPDDEYLKIYNFCVESTNKNKFAEYKEDVCDGNTFSFTFIDTEGNAHVIYSGYCYDNKELLDIMGMISKYSID